MRTLLAALLFPACTPTDIVQDTGALRPPCEPHLPVFDMPIDPGATTVALEHHLGLCTDPSSAMGRLTVRRSTPDASCTTILTFTGDGETSCDDCTDAWAIRDPLLDSDCPEELVALTVGPEDLGISPWIGWHIDGTVHGENAAGPVALPAYSFDYAKLTEGPEAWIDVHGASLLDRE